MASTCDIWRPPSSMFECRRSRSCPGGNGSERPTAKPPVKCRSVGAASLMRSTPAHHVEDELALHGSEHALGAGAPVRAAFLRIHVEDGANINLRRAPVGPGSKRSSPRYVPRSACTAQPNTARHTRHLFTLLIAARSSALSLND